MDSQRAKDIVAGLLRTAGVSIGGEKPWDVRVHNEKLYARLLSGGSMAAGDSYVEGWWDVERLDEFFYRLFMADLHEKFAGPWSRIAAWYARLFNRQTLRRSHRVAEVHYHLGEDLFRAMLDESLSYTCAYWENAGNLEEAQQAKLGLVCRKLELEPGMSVLDLGCGWGAFAKYAAENYRVNVLGVNIAEDQVALARRLCRGLPVELRAMDYRQVRGRFDRVVSIGIMEHVGPRNYRTYMEHAAACLKEDGIAFVHTIGQNAATYRCDPWFDRHIFPNGVTPSIGQLAAAMDGLFVLEDCHNIGPHYDPTLMAWHENLERRWPSLERRYGEEFRRMMRYYLLSSAASFRSRRSQLFQLVMTKPGRLQPDCRGQARAKPSAELQEAIL